MKERKPLTKAQRIARAINWRLSHDRSLPKTADREAYLRSLLKLSSTERRT
jgi:hypothetical protein